MGMDTADPRSKPKAQRRHFGIFRNTKLILVDDRVKRSFPKIYWIYKANIYSILRNIMKSFENLFPEGGLIKTYRLYTLIEKGSKRRGDEVTGSYFQILMCSAPGVLLFLTKKP